MQILQCIYHMQKEKKWIPNVNLNSFLLKYMIIVCGQKVKKTQFIKKNQPVKGNRLFKA